MFWLTLAVFFFLTLGGQPILGMTVGGLFAGATFVVAGIDAIRWSGPQGAVTDPTDAGSVSTSGPCRHCGTAGWIPGTQCRRCGWLGP